MTRDSSRRSRARRYASRGIPLRAVAPNAVTALALCSGLTAVRFAIASQWELAIAAIIVAGVLDGLDGRIARLLKGESRFGAELDSLSDVIAFGVAPALVLFLWSIVAVPRYGWVFALAFTVCAALRLARFNAAIDHSGGHTGVAQKSAGYLTGVPAPVAAGLALLPMYLWLLTEVPIFRSPFVVAPWLGIIAFLMISNIPTFSWSFLRLRRNIRLEALAGVAILFGALLSASWATLTALCAVYLALIPLSVRSQMRVKRPRAVPSGRGDTPLA